MNSHNLRKRRAYGHESAPALPVSQDPSLSSTPYAPTHHRDPFSEQELYILERAAAVLNCPIENLLVLSQSSHPSPTSPTAFGASNKRLRANSYSVGMASHGKHTPSRLLDHAYYGYHHRDGALESSISSEGSVQGWSQYLASCAPCTTCEPPAHVTIPAPDSYGYPPSKPGYDQEKASVPPAPLNAMSQTQQHIFDCDDANMGSPLMTHYQALQPSRPLAVQPTTRNEGMVYPGAVGSESYLGMPPPSSSSTVDHVTNSYHFGPPSLRTPEQPPMHCDIQRDAYVPEIRDHPTSGHASLDIVLPNERPPPAKRGPFKSNDDREKTAVTRKIGSCIRCKMQRIRCEINPDDVNGTCLTCLTTSNMKSIRLPCLRYKITDVRLFKPGQVKGYEWTRRWSEGRVDDISHWDSSDTKIVKVTESYSRRPVSLRVRRFVPQDGDALERTWIHNGQRRKVNIPPYAIVSLEEAREAYSEYIRNGYRECCQTLLSHKDKMLLGTYLFAIQTASSPQTPPKEKELLTKALQLWMAIRVNSKTTTIVGEETLGMARNILDNSPLHGSIPLPPVMGAQIEMVLTNQIQASLRREMLDNLQTMTQAKSQKTWFTTYLVTFILLHNVALLCQHDAGYARKHGIKNHFAREDSVREYQFGANVLLAYFHYCNKGVYPFSTECKEQDLLNLAELDDRKTKVVQYTRRKVEENRKNWARIRESNDYENDFYYISQLYDENWAPGPTI